MYVCISKYLKILRYIWNISNMKYEIQDNYLLDIYEYTKKYLSVTAIYNDYFF